MSAIKDSAQVNSSSAPSDALKTKVPLTGVAETLLIPLEARARDARSKIPILNDQTALKLANCLDYDFTKLNISEAECMGIIVRTRWYDSWTAKFLAQNPNAVVLHLACGLDDRASRLEWGRDVLWVDVDLPETVQLRRQVINTSEAFKGRDYGLIAADITQAGWLEDLPSNRPTVVIMEGLLSYLSEQDHRTMLHRLMDHCISGELLFDCISSFVLSASNKGRVLKSVSATGAKFQTAIDDVEKLRSYHEKIRELDPVRFVNAPGVELFPFTTRVAIGLMSWIPIVRDSSRLVRIRFELKR